MSDESYALKILESGLPDRVSERFYTLDTLDKCNINVNFDGSSMYHHRLLPLGYDPFWGFLWCTGHIKRDNDHRRQAGARLLFRLCRTTTRKDKAMSLRRPQTSTTFLLPM